LSCMFYNVQTVDCEYASSGILISIRSHKGNEKGEGRS